MEFRELTCEEFKKIEKKQKKYNFYQTVSWANVKKTTGWESYYVGVFDGKKNLGIALLLAKKILNKKMFYIPRGFAHGFLVLSDVAEFCYKVDNIYDHENEGGLKWNDEDVNIVWPQVPGMKPEEYLTSEKDGKWPSLKEIRETDLFKNLK